MGLVDRQWAYGNGNAMDTAAYSYGDPQYTYPYSYPYNSGQVATLPSPAIAQTHTVVASPSTSTTVQRATAPRTTGTPTQGQTSTDAPTRPAAMQVTTNSMATTSPTTSLLSFAVETTSSAASDGGVTRSSGATFGVFTSSPAITVAGSSSTAQLTPTGPSGIANSEAPAAASGGMGKGEIAGIVLAIMFALGLGCVFYKVWRCRKAAQRPDSTFVQYPFSTDAARATTRMAEVLPPVLDISRALAPERDSAHRDMVGGSTTAATLATSSPAGASGYDSGLAVYPLGEKSRVHSAATPSRFSAPFALASPLSPSPLVHSPVSPASPCNTPIAPLLAAHSRLSSAAPMLPYAWDHPSPTSEYLSPTSERQSTFRASWFYAESGGVFSPARASYGTLSSTPAYGSSAVDSRPPSYSRY